MEGVEPTRLAALDPKSSMSTNFTTSAILKYYTKSLFDTYQLLQLKASANLSKFSLTKIIIDDLFEKKFKALFIYWLNSKISFELKPI